MNSPGERPHVLRTPAAEREASEDRTLDAALASAAREIAESLQREEAQLQRLQRKQRASYAWIPFVLIVLAAGVMVLLLPRKDAAEVRDTELPTTPSTVTSTEFDAEIENVDLFSGDFTLHLPSGFEWQVSLVKLKQGRYELTSRTGLNCLGVYLMQGNRLQMELPNDPRLTEFQWLVENGDHLKMVAQPPAAKTGGNYLGATMIRNLDHPFEAK
jgi:hypothetical protein